MNRMLGGVLLGTLLLASCSGDPARPAPMPSQSPSASATSSAPSPSPSATPRPPAMPPAAKGTSPAAAEAFARYYVDLINYAQATGDVARLKALARTTCRTCAVISEEVRSVYDNGGRLEGGNWRLGPVVRSGSVNGIQRMRFRVSIAAQRAYADADAEPVETKAANGRIDFYLRLVRDGWQIEYAEARA